jgi:D-alanyl-D-alanine carboxypeptidase (penicillin-binding protein 5/6)
MRISRFKRRNLSLIAGVLALAVTVTSFAANGDEVTGGGRLGESGVIFNDTTGDGVAAPPDTTASSYIIADLDTGEILAAKNPHKRLPPSKIGYEQNLYWHQEGARNNRK